MTQVGAYEAKTRLSQLLKQVAKGEEIIITKHGVPVAALTPIPAACEQNPEAAIAGIKAFRQEHQLGGLSIRQLIDEGHP